MTTALELREQLTFEDAYIHAFEDRKRDHEKGCGQPLEAGKGKDIKILLFRFITVEILDCDNQRGLIGYFLFFFFLPLVH